MQRKGTADGTDSQAVKIVLKVTENTSIIDGIDSPPDIIIFYLRSSYTGRVLTTE